MLFKKKHDSKHISKQSQITKLNVHDKAKKTPLITYSRRMLSAAMKVVFNIVLASFF